MTTRSEKGAGDLHLGVETYFDGDRWHTRRSDSDEPFASGYSRARMIAVGVEVARWNGLRHIIRDADGWVVESNEYVTGPYPSRSPVSSSRMQH